MRRFFYKLKNLFKTQQQKEIEARIQFNQDWRSFERYYRQLDSTIKGFMKMAKDAELAGNHDNARTAAIFVAKLQRTQTRVQGLLQRFKMMYEMQGLAGMMTQFMEASARMGVKISSDIDIKRMMRDTVEMEKGLSMLDAMTSQMDMVFETIDSGMTSSLGLDAESQPSEEEMVSEADRLIDQIMGRHNTMTYTSAQSAQPAQPSAAQHKAPSADEDTDARIKKMLSDLDD